MNGMQLVGSLLATSGRPFLGMGALKCFHTMIGTTQATVSALTALAIESNENKEQGEQERIGTTLKERAINIISKDVVALPKALAFAAVGGICIVANDRFFGGESLQEYYTSSFGFVPQNEYLVKAFSSAIVMTAAETVLGLASINTIVSSLNIFRGAFSGGQALAVKDNEGREGGEARKIGDTMWNRAVRFMSNDAQDVFKGSTAVAVSVAALYAGAYLGGESFQSSFTRFIRGQ